MKKRLRRAGHDFTGSISTFERVPNGALTEALDPQHFTLLSEIAKRLVWMRQLPAGRCVCVLGRETSGLPDHILAPLDGRSLRLRRSRRPQFETSATDGGIVVVRACASMVRSEPGGLGFIRSVRRRFSS